MTTFTIYHRGKDTFFYRIFGNQYGRKIMIGRGSEPLHSDYYTIPIGRNETNEDAVIMALDIMDDIEENG